MFANHFDDDGDGDVNLAAHPLLQRVPKTCLGPDRSSLPVEAPEDHNGCAGLLLMMLMKMMINHTSFLSFFLHRQIFWRIKFTPKFTQ